MGVAGVMKELKLWSMHCAESCVMELSLPIQNKWNQYLFCNISCHFKVAHYSKFWWRGTQKNTFLHAWLLFWGGELCWYKKWYNVLVL
jgi:hypothetical protein